MENKGTIFGIIALIIGGSGLGLGAFSVITIQTIEAQQGPPGEDGTDGIDGIDGINGTDGIDGINGTEGIDGIDGIDAPGYFCSSAAEVQLALDSIGDKSGKIIINKSITLTSKININGGGSYLIQGNGPGIIIDCDGNWNAFDITNATTCIIRELKINSSDINSLNIAAIKVNEVHNNPIYIEKVHIIGDLDLEGHGIDIESGNVKISNCYIANVREGIYQSSGNNSYFIANNLNNGSQMGISIYGSFNVIANNYIRNFQDGINVFGDNNVIKDNFLNSIQQHGIYLTVCSNNFVSGNFFSNLGSAGIFAVNCDFITVSENQITDFISYGIYLVNSDKNIISGNQISFGNGNGLAITNGDYNVITGNLIYNLSRGGIWLSGIYIFDGADFNTISGNGVFNCTAYGGANIGYGIHIISMNCYDNTVMGNTSLNNEDNWKDLGTNTFGNATNNNFG